eukprot:365652-Chlamydomonas_euryale.AAC.2
MHARARTCTCVCTITPARTRTHLVGCGEPDVVSATAPLPVWESLLQVLFELKHHAGAMHWARIGDRGAPPGVIRPTNDGPEEARHIQGHVEEVGLLRVKRPGEVEVDGGKTRQKEWVGVWKR